MVLIHFYSHSGIGNLVTFRLDLVTTLRPIYAEPRQMACYLDQILSPSRRDENLFQTGGVKRGQGKLKLNDVIMSFSWSFHGLFTYVNVGQYLRQGYNLPNLTVVAVSVGHNVPYNVPYQDNVVVKSKTGSIGTLKQLRAGLNQF